MKPSDEIFLLIKSMSGKERQFFRKKFLSLIEDADNNYLKLFDEISKQSANENEYDESKIKKGNYGGKFIKNLPFHKNFLYNTILNSLSFFNREHKDSYSVRNQITQSEILADKLLYEQSYKILQRAKKTAVEKDLHSNRYEIIHTEKLIRRHLDSVEEYSNIVKNLFSEQYEMLRLNKMVLDYYSLNDKVGLFLRTNGSGRARDKDKLNEFEKIFESPLLRNFENATSFITKYIFYNLNIQYHLTNENYEKAYDCARSAVELCENNLDKMKGKPDNYIFSLNNLLNCECRTNRFDKCESTGAKLKNIILKFPDLNESSKVFIFYSHSVLMLSIYITTTNINKLNQLEEEITNDLKLYEEKTAIYQRIILYYFLSTSNFIRDNFEKCIYWNGKIFNFGKTDLSEDYQCYARIIQLISYYELGYIDSMEYALKSAYHFISKKKKVYKYENIIQKYLRRSFSVKTEKELNEMFIEMKDELEIIFNDPYEKNAFDAFNILYWLESKIRKIPVLEILKAKK